MSREYDYVVNLLNNSISPVETTRNQALEVILGLELNPSFLLTLLEVGTSSNDNISRLSLILLKKSFFKLHSFTKRKNCNNSLDYGNIYQDLKANLLKNVTVKYINNTAFIPKDLCLLVRRQCRDNFPHNWMEMYRMLLINLNSLEEGGEIKVFNLVFLIYHIFKERMSVLLPSFRGHNYKIAQDLFPHISNLWAIQFIGKWKNLESNPELFTRSFSELQLRTSVYLDNTLYNFYSHGIKEIHKNNHLLELLYNMFMKFKILSQVNRLKLDQTNLVKKNMSRILRGLDKLISNNPLSMVFIDFSVFLNEIFDILVRKDWKDLECECIIVLKRIFGSSTMNNEKYMNMYFAQVEPLPKIETKVAPVDAPPRHYRENINGVEYYKNYETLLKFNSEVKDQQIWEIMSRQLTCAFYRVLSSRGGYLKFLDLIRTNYMKVDLNALEEWNLDQYPEISPSTKVVDELILEMNINFVEIFGLVFNSMLEYKNEYFEYDTYLQLYILCFRNFYEYHKNEHFMALLQIFYKLLELPVKEYTGLMVYRISRIVNMWCKKKLISQLVKKEILKFLMKTISWENSKIRVQHVVPLYNLYKNTEDEPIWPDFFRRHNIHNIVKNLLEIAEVDVPIIRLRALELLCNFCMEYDEEGVNLVMILKMYTQIQSASVCEAALNTILDYIRKLDMPPVMMDQYVLNTNFLTFFLGIIKNTLDLDYRNGINIRRMTRFSLVDETFLEMWLSFLRIYSVRKEQLEQLKEMFQYFRPLLYYFTDNQTPEETTIFNTFGLKILAEYVLILGSYMELDQEYVIEKAGEEVVFKNAIATFSQTRLNMMCSKSSNEEIELPISVYHYFGFGESWASQSYVLLTSFFESLEKLGNLQGSSSSQMSELALNQKSTKSQQMTILEENSSDIEKILPFINKIVFTSQTFHMLVQSMSQSEVELWLNERLLTLFNLAKSLRRNHILQLGCIILSCYIISSYPLMIYPFVQYKGERYYTDDFDSENTSLYQSHPGTFIMSYFLKILSNNSRNYRFVSEIRSKGIKEDKIPGSRRFEYVKYAWLTNSNKPYRSDVYQEGLELAVRSIVEATRRLPEEYLKLLLAEANKLSSEVQGILNSILM